MRILITDDRRIWNEKNSVLQAYKHLILKICVYGEPVKKEWECFTYPDSMKNTLGSDNFAGKRSRRLADLEKVADELEREIGVYEDVLVLSDGTPESLYPYYVLRNRIGSMHLLMISPMSFFPHRQIEAAYDLMSDLGRLKSFFYYDAEPLLNEVRNVEGKTYRSFFDCLQEKCNEFLLNALVGIEAIKYRTGPYYFDFFTKRYIELKEGTLLETAIKYDLPTRKQGPKIKRDTNLLLGEVLYQEYLLDTYASHGSIEQLEPRIDGKSICNFLKKQRMTIAKANGIYYETSECPSEGPCAGTCEKCDAEALYLQKALAKIPSKKRVYPKFLIEEWEENHDK